MPPVINPPPSVPWQPVRSSLRTLPLRRNPSLVPPYAGFPFFYAGSPSAEPIPGSALRGLSRKEKRYRKDTNHVISKRLVGKAKDTGRGIALEELKGIRDRTTVRKSDRAKHSGWAFYQLQHFIVYKAAIAGVLVVFIDPYYTSRQCSVCGHAHKSNRKSQAEFLCVSCGHQANADENAALVIAQRAELCHAVHRSPPRPAGRGERSYKPLPLGRGS
ncbi:MAG: transposase [Candidatus Competibacteraceae bacterium]